MIFPKSGLLYTLFQGGLDAMERGDVEHAIMGFGQSIHGAGNLIKYSKKITFNEKVFEKVGKPILDFVGRGITKAVTPLKVGLAKTLINQSFSAF
jgi:hypothetical protein